MTAPPSRPNIVPYVAARTTEQPLGKIVLAPRGLGIAYVLEDVHDRDAHGVLWQRTGLNRTGRPEFGRLHALRQRRVMHKLLCQVCGGPASHTEAGVLWLLGDEPDKWRGWPERTAATHPPLCLPCADLARRLCPYLSSGYVAFRVRNPDPYGVYGLIYRRAGPHVTPDRHAIVPYNAPDIPWVRAAQAVRSLHGCTHVDLDDELASNHRRTQSASSA